MLDLVWPLRLGGQVFSLYPLGPHQTTPVLKGAFAIVLTVTMESTQEIVEEDDLLMNSNMLVYSPSFKHFLFMDERR